MNPYPSLTLDVVIILNNRNNIETGNLVRIVNNSHRAYIVVTVVVAWANPGVSLFIRRPQAKVETILYIHLHLGHI